MNLDLERLLEFFFKEEELDADQYKCTNSICEKKHKDFGNVSFAKKNYLWKLPKILVIHLKRFNFGRYRREKLDTMVKFPIKNLNMKAYIGESSNILTALQIILT